MKTSVAETGVLCMFTLTLSAHISIFTHFSSLIILQLYSIRSCRCSYWISRNVDGLIPYPPSRLPTHIGFMYQRMLHLICHLYFMGVNTVLITFVLPLKFTWTAQVVSLLEHFNVNIHIYVCIVKTNNTSAFM